MDYTLAIWLGRTALFLAALAPLHYFLRLVFVRLQRQNPPVALRLRGTVAFARTVHPYMGLLVVVAPLYHGYVMGSTHTLSLKVGLGMVTVIVAFFMAGSGWQLKGRPAFLPLRRLHRNGFFLLAFFLAAHRLA